MPEIVTKFN